MKSQNTNINGLRKLFAFGRPGGRTKVQQAIGKYLDGDTKALDKMPTVKKIIDTGVKKLGQVKKAQQDDANEIASLSVDRLKQQNKPSEFEVNKMKKQQDDFSHLADDEVRTKHWEHYKAKEALPNEIASRTKVLFHEDEKKKYWDEMKKRGMVKTVVPQVKIEKSEIAKAFDQWLEKYVPDEDKRDVREDKLRAFLDWLGMPEHPEKPENVNEEEIYEPGEDRANVPWQVSQLGIKSEKK